MPDEQAVPPAEDKNVMTLRLGERVRAVFRFRRIGLEALAVGTGQAVAAVGAIVGVRVLTEVLPPSEYGELALAMTVGTLGLQVFLAPLSVSAMRFFAPASEAGDLRGFLGAVRRLTGNAVAIVAAVAALTVVVLLAAGKAAWVPLTAAAFAFTVFSGAATVLDGMQHAARQRVVASAHSAAAVWLRFVAAVALIQLVTATSGVAMAGYALASALMLGSQLLFFRSRIAAHAEAGTAANDEPRWRSAMLSYGVPFAAWGVFTSAQMASDRWALGAFAHAEDVGLYAVVYQLGYYPILSASMLLGQVVAPVLFARAGDASDPERVRTAVRLAAKIAAGMAVLTVLGCAITAALHPLVGRLLLAVEYRSVTYLLPWMMLAGGIFATGQVAALFFMITNRSAALTTPKIATAILGIAFNIAGARWFGVAGVVGAAIAFSAVYCAWILIASLRIYRRPAAEAGR